MEATRFQPYTTHVMVASTSYARPHQMVRDKLYSQFLLFMAYMYTENSLVINVITTQLHLLDITGSSMIYTLLRIFLCICYFKY